MWACTACGSLGCSSGFFQRWLQHWLDLTLKRPQPIPWPFRRNIPKKYGSSPVTSLPLFWLLYTVFNISDLSCTFPCPDTMFLKSSFHKTVLTKALSIFSSWLLPLLFVHSDSSCLGCCFEFQAVEAYMSFSSLAIYFRQFFIMFIDLNIEKYTSIDAFLYLSIYVSHTIIPHRKATSLEISCT